ncbi:MAG: hypothetical protein LQ350_008640, partial [Teloschistes chrysophthalmus]
KEHRFTAEVLFALVMASSSAAQNFSGANFGGTQIGQQNIFNAGSGKTVLM